MQINVVEGLTCPNCGAQEMHENGDQLQIRAFKTSVDGSYWWSQCLVCSGGYDKINGTFTADNNTDEGWF